jgi:acyl transferase domain-containing protein/thioesterase domain-containing protein/acyl carrier protein
MTHVEQDFEGRVAVIGMAGRFPGARDLKTFWSNLRGGVEAVQFFSEAELLAAGESLDNIRDPAYVPAAARLDDIDKFDAGFFGMSPRDAAVFDPQHRLFLECAWETFEHAGYVGDRIDGAVAVFASCGLSEYMFKNVLANERVTQSVGEWLIRHTGNDSNFLATRVSYELDLRGPSMNVQTACSSTLVAVHLACQSLLSGECDLALAGGSVVSPVQDRGYLYKEGEILSPDGHCRAFDAKSAGTIISSACGCVLLKPLASALHDGDHVLAVIRGSAINNDGRDKVGYLAPSVSGQAGVVAEALAVAGVAARQVSYVEAHGTGTLIGDPIEIAGITQAYRETTDDTGFCAIGSLKTNIGHAGEAAGVAALIKAVLSLQYAEIPPSLHFESPNPQADFPNSPFYVNARLRPWTVEGGQTRIAGITGLGAGGTNAHVIVEQAPDPEPSGPSRSVQLITVSARSAEAVERAAHDLSAHLAEYPDLNLADVAYTRLAGRKPFRARRAVVAATSRAAAEALASSDPKTVIAYYHKGDPPSVVFMMPGGGAQYAGMGRQLYEAEPVYRAAIDACCDVVNPTLGLDLRTLMFPDGDMDQGSKRLERPSVALPALFATEYSMAKWLESLGIVPGAMIGHSAGEYVAACLAGVVSMPEGLALVSLRGRLFETLPVGAMLSVSLPAEEARARMPAGLSIAAVNSPKLCVASGPIALIEEMEAALGRDDVDVMRVHIDVAAHSSMLEPILAEFGDFCRTIRFSPPSISYASNLTGTWVTEADVTDPMYWVRHLREAVRFSDGIETILTDPSRVLVEIGPGRTLTSLARQASGSAVAMVPTLRHPKEDTSDLAFALAAVGRVWASGVDLDSADLHRGEKRRRVPLPTYPFEHHRYWVDPDVSGAKSASRGSLHKRPDLADWFYTPSWKRSVMTPSPASTTPVRWMWITDGARLADKLMAKVSGTGDRLTSVTFGDRFHSFQGSRYVVNPSRRTDWTDLVEALKDRDEMPDRIVHMTAVGPPRPQKVFGRHHDAVIAFDAFVERDHASMLFLAQALSAESHPIRLSVVTSGVHALGTEQLHPERALLHGACRVIPRELGHVTAVAIDIDQPAPSSHDERVLAARLLQELAAEPTDELVVYRRGDRWIRSFDPIRLPPAAASPWQPSGVYLVTGGLGGIGLAVAEQIATSAAGATLVLLGRSAMPDETDWPALLASDATDTLMLRRIGAIQRIKACGGRVITASVDVTDRAEMTRVVASVHALAGHITGVIHSAGILRDALIALRTPNTVSPVVDVKAKGAMVLQQVLAKDPPELLVLCSSVSSIIGLPGQVDYTAANAFLDAFAIKATRGGRTRAVAVNWNAWQDVGMAVDAAEAALERDRVPFTDPSSQSATELFDHVADSGDEVLFTSRLSRARTWLLAEHVIRGGDALIPGTGFVEIMRSAVTWGQATQHPVELDDVFFISSFAVAEDEVRALKVRWDRSASSIVVFSDVEASPHASAVARPLEPGAVPWHDLDGIRARCGVQVVDFDGYSDQQFMDFGPRWGSLRRIEYGHGEALVTTVVPGPFVSELESLWLHPAVLDTATGSAQALIPGFSDEDTFYVPFSYGRVLVRGPIPERAVSHVRLRESSAKDLAVFEVAICDESGNEIVSVEGFTMRRVDKDVQLMMRRSPVAVALEVPPTENAITTALRDGMSPAEGVDALERILAADVAPQMVASSVDLLQWIAKVDAEASAVGAGDIARDFAGGPQFERPNISSTFVGPKTPIERELAAMWSELLGVEEVGRNDDFFELGGQSLIAVRLFSRLRKKYSIDLPLATLFEAPTIAECAAIVAGSLGVADVAKGDVVEGDGGEAAVEPGAPPEGGAQRADRAAFRSLVTIQKGGDRIPFFCAHGAGGNVLNFRDLSLAMGRSQPFYGLQARGIDGVLPPHETIPEMATAYLQEIRTVQPHGPYMFGGYSGGGLIAYEMARQATAAGEAVAMVVLLDTIPVTTGEIPVTMEMRIKRLRKERTVYLRDMVTRRIAGRRLDKELARLDQILAQGENVPSELREMHLERSFAKASENYSPPRWAGRVVLLRADEWHMMFDALGDTYGWDKIVEGRVELIRVPGSHDTLVLEPNASTLVRRLRDALDSTLEAVED